MMLFSFEPQQASHVVLAAADLRAGEALPQAEVPGFHREGHARQGAQDDGRAGQDVVPEQEDKVEVSVVFFV